MATATGTGAGEYDITVPADKSGVIQSSNYTGTGLTTGGFTVSKSVVYYLNFIRWDIAIPAGATIDAVTIEQTAGTSVGTSMNYAGGFVRTDGFWDQPGSMSNYTHRNQMQMAQWSSGAGNNLNVFPDGVQGFVESGWVPQSSGEIVIGDGDGAVSYDISAPNLVPQLQQFLADEGTISVVCLHQYRTYSGLSQHYQLTRSFNHSISAEHPRLTVEYTPLVVPVESPISARPSSALVAAARAKSSATTTAREATASVSSGRAKSSAVVSSRASTGPVVSGRGRTA